MSSRINSSYGFVSETSSSSVKRRRVPPSDENNEIVMSIYKSKSDSMDMGLAILNCKTFELTLLNFCDSSTFIRTINQIKVYVPTVILLPEVQMNPQMDKLKYIVNSNVNDKIKVKLQKLKCFNSETGLNNTKIFCECDELALQETLNGKELSLAAFNSCIEYCLSLKLFRPRTKMRLKFGNCESTMLIDTCTIRDLELVDSVCDHGISLFTFLDRYTESIKLRLESVQELISNEDILASLRSHLKTLHDLEKMFSSFLDKSDIPGNQDQRINNLIMLKSTLDQTTQICKYLEDSKSHLLVQIKQIISHEYIQAALTAISHYIQDDCQWAKNNLELTNQKVNAIKTGVNGFLDVSRQLYEALLEEVNDLVSNLADNFELSIDFRYEPVRGFFMRIKDYSGHLNDLPPVFINKVKKRKLIECTTINLMKQSSRFNDVVLEINILNNNIIEELHTTISSYIPIFLMICEAIGTLDLLCGFASFVAQQKRPYVCPEFGKDLNIRRSRHPILEASIPGFVPNDYSCIREISRFQIITGANMSGKSVYLRQIAYLAIMAQIGCFIPADYAVMSVFEGLYTRISADNTEVNASSFSREMTEIATIMKMATNKSLVIIDELGRGSSYTDGFSICLAVLESFISGEAVVFSSTHFREIAAILGNKSCVVASHMETTDINGKLEMKYNLLKGKVETEGYGIRYAEYSKLLPDMLMENAKDLATQIKKLRTVEGNEQAKMLSRRRKLILEFYFALNHIRELEGDANFKINSWKK
ncbi:MutS protein 4 [Spathaspora sp. JA1]|nr:MutS protein 4 [Spathaspora sp. JA1]